MIAVADVANLFNNKTLIAMAVAVFIVIAGGYIGFANASESNNMMGSGMGSMMKSGNMMSGMINMSNGMMCSMMTQPPNDVIIKAVGQVVGIGKTGKVTLQITDKNDGKPVSDAQVIIGIERGAPMSTMDMMGPMFKAKNLGSGKYEVKITPDEKGYYTLHTHVIPKGKSMHAMMENHMDVGVIAK